MDVKTDRGSIYHWLLKTEFDQMSKYLETVSSLLSSSKRELEEFVERQASELGEEDKYQFYESYQDEFAELEEEFPRLLLNGFIITWYSFVEQQLIGLCDRRKLTITVSIRDREKSLGDGIKRAYNFLSKAAGYQIENSAWQELQIIGWLRNHIVHRGDKWVPHSHIKPEGAFIQVKMKDHLTEEEYVVYVTIDPNIYAYLKKHSLISAFGFRLAPILTPNVEYCKHLVQFGMTFFKKIYEDLGLI